MLNAPVLLATVETALVKVQFGLLLRNGNIVWDLPAAALRHLPAWKYGLRCTVDTVTEGNRGVSGLRQASQSLTSRECLWGPYLSRAFFLFITELLDLPLCSQR